MLGNVFCLYFSPIKKRPRKKIIFKVFVFWRYSKTLSLLMILNSKEYKLFIPLYGLKQPLEVILKISQNLQENTWVRVTFIIKLKSEVCGFSKKRDCGIGAFLWFLRSCQEHLLSLKTFGRLFLYVTSVSKVSKIYLFKVNNENTGIICEIYSKLTIKTPEWHQWRRSGIFVVNFKQILHVVLLFPFLLWTKQILAGSFLLTEAATQRCS